MKDSNIFVSNHQLYIAFQKCQSVCIDSRKVTKGNLFFAIKGASFDGNEFAAAAIEQGARFAVIENPKYQLDERFLLVKNTLVAFQEIAKIHRKNLNTTKWLAIVGSNGKTTTKELAYHVLKEKYTTYCTLGNLNNHIGVPLTILNIPTNTDIAIIEMGANHLGEHRFLCEIAQPDYGIITNCGKDHLEGYGSEVQVIASNVELYDYLRKKKGTIFINMEDEVLMQYREGLTCLYYGAPQIKSAIPLLAKGIIKSIFPKVSLNIYPSNSKEGKKIQINAQLYGAFQKDNILAATAIGRYFGVSDKAIQKAITAYIPKNNRSQTINWGSNLIFLDGYNANPSSVLAIVNDFQNYPVTNKILVLGDMYELGKYSEGEHEKVLSFIEDYPYKAVLLIGINYAKCPRRAHFHYFQDSYAAKEWLEKQSFEQHYFLAKASRGIQIETVFPIKN